MPCARSPPPPLQAPPPPASSEPQPNTVIPNPNRHRSNSNRPISLPSALEAVPRRSPTARPAPRRSTRANPRGDPLKNRFSQFRKKPDPKPPKPNKERWISGPEDELSAAIPPVIELPSFPADEIDLRPTPSGLPANPPLLHSPISSIASPTPQPSPLNQYSWDHTSDEELTFLEKNLSHVTSAGSASFDEHQEQRLIDIRQPTLPSLHQSSPLSTGFSLEAYRLTSAAAFNSFLQPPLSPFRGLNRSVVSLLAPQLSADLANKGRLCSSSSSISLFDRNPPSSRFTEVGNELHGIDSLPVFSPTTPAPI